MLKNGIVIENVLFKIKVMCFICDRPARSFVKNIISHTGYYAYERCIQKGLSIENRIVFPSTTADKRTDESFRQQKNPEHHTGPSPLLNIRPKINMILCFPLDIMQLCFLGVMKKLIECWLTNIADSRLSRINIMRFSQRITNLTNQVPVEFQRQLLQSLGFISKWKATEFRFFLLYCGPLLLKDLLPNELFEHFLLLHVALRILCCNKLSQKYSF